MHVYKWRPFKIWNSRSVLSKLCEVARVLMCRKKSLKSSKQSFFKKNSKYSFILEKIAKNFFLSWWTASQEVKYGHYCSRLFLLCRLITNFSQKFVLFHSFRPLLLIKVERHFWTIFKNLNTAAYPKIFYRRYLKIFIFFDFP